MARTKRKTNPVIPAAEAPAQAQKQYRAAAYARLSVEDSGIGIEARHLPRLAERFYRVDSSRSSSTGGTGLGLAIVKHVLMRHNGRLEIRSRPGAGSTFTCVFGPERVLRRAEAASA